MITQNNKKLGLQLTVGTNTYLILDAFGAYPSLTSLEYRMLPEADRTARVSAFYSYLSTLLGIDVEAAVLPGSEDIVLDGGLCPVTAYYRVAVSAVRGSALILNNGATSGIFASGEAITVRATPAGAYNTFSHWEDESGVTVGTTDYYVFTLGRDIQLKAVYNEVVTYNVIVSNSDGRGVVSGGGTVPASEAVYISSANADEKSYAFDGWYIAGTNTRVSVGETGYYAPQPQYADASSSIYLESRYLVVKPANLITVSITSQLGGQITIGATAQEAVASAITITGSYYNDLVDYVKFTLILPAGATSVDRVYSVPNYSSSYIESIADWTPTSDDTYDYQVNHL